MRRLGICEEKGSGIDKVIFQTEFYQLPAPDFRIGDHRTTAILFAHKAFPEMGSSDRVWACYLHCCLRYVGNEKMTNQSLRDRFLTHRPRLPNRTGNDTMNVYREARTLSTGRRVPA